MMGDFWQGFGWGGVAMWVWLVAARAWWEPAVGKVLDRLVNHAPEEFGDHADWWEAPWPAECEWCGAPCNPGFVGCADCLTGIYGKPFDE